MANTGYVFQSTVLSGQPKFWSVICLLWFKGIYAWQLNYPWTDRRIGRVCRLEVEGDASALLFQIKYFFDAFMTSKRT